jgi:hypothetical protein
MWDLWECEMCNAEVSEAARVYCGNCATYHNVCLDCARDVETHGYGELGRDLYRRLLTTPADSQGRARLVIFSLAGDIAGRCETRQPLGTR